MREGIHCAQHAMALSKQILPVDTLVLQALLADGTAVEKGSYLQVAVYDVPFGTPHPNVASTTLMGLQREVCAAPAPQNS